MSEKSKLLTVKPSAHGYSEVTKCLKAYLDHFLGDLDVFCGQIYRKVLKETEKQHPRTREPFSKKISTDFAPPGVNEKQVWHSCPLVSGRE